MIINSILLRLIISAIVGLAIGLIFKHKDYPRVFALICVGAALVTIVSIEFFRFTYLPWHSDPGRIAAQIISALGFIGAGFIWISEKKEIIGLAHSAALWYTAIIGMFIGTGLSTVTVAVLTFVAMLYIVGTTIIRKMK
ncbi:MAG TPA: MgtC/SapB family protein [Syntrophomonadaceae bacterium]|nr:MgtC/SapB family protein [Syntrophomonadaceae bacterium]